MSNRKPSYKLTRTTLEDTMMIWWRWSKGESSEDTKHFIELNVDKYPKAPSHRTTIDKVKQELLLYPKEVLREFVVKYPETRQFVLDKRSDLQLELQESMQEDMNRQRHLGEIHNLLTEWERDLARKADRLDPLVGRGVPISATPVYDDKLFDYLLQHCSEVDKAFQRLKDSSLCRLRYTNPNLWSLSDDWLYDLFIHLGEDLLFDIHHCFLAQLAEPDNLSPEQGYEELAKRFTAKHGLTEYPKELHDRFVYYFSDPQMADARQCCVRARKDEDDLRRSINHCLLSYSYVHSTCDWCP